MGWLWWFLQTAKYILPSDLIVPGSNGYAWIRRAIVLEHSNTLDARQAGPIAKKGGESCFLSSFDGVIASPKGTGESCMCFIAKAFWKLIALLVVQLQLVAILINTAPAERICQI
jgi:hypothetical protein